MTPASDQSVAYGSGSERPGHKYSNDANASLYSITKFLNYDERPFSERLAAGRLYDTYKGPDESELESWQRNWPTVGKKEKAGENHGMQGSRVDSIATPTVTYRKSDLARQITEWLLEWLTRWAAAAPLLDGSSGDPANSGSGHASGAGASPGRSANSNAEGKRRRKPGKGSDEDNNGQSKKAKTVSPPRHKRDYLACPFLKHKPQRYMHQEKCCRSWPNVSRLKNDHIYRYHQVPGVQCPRCGGIIDSSTKSEHISCAEQIFTLRDGADSSMMQELRSKSTARNESEEEKWHAAYKILFGVPRDQQPSPYPDDHLQFRQEIVTFLQSNIGPLVRRSLRANRSGLDWEENVSRDITIGVVGLINRDFRLPGSPITRQYDHEPSSSSSRTNITRSHTEEGYHNEFGGAFTPGELAGGGSGSQNANWMTNDSVNDLRLNINTYLSGIGGGGSQSQHNTTENQHDLTENPYGPAWDQLYPAEGLDDSTWNQHDTL